MASFWRGHGDRRSSQSGPGELLLFDLAGVKMLATVQGARRTPRGRLRADAKTLATSGFDNAVKVRDATTGAVLATIGTFKSLVSAVAYLPDGKTLVTGCVDASVKLWDTASGHESALAGQVSAVNGLAIAPDGALLAAAGSDRTAKLWDVTSGRAPVHAPGAGPAGRVRRLCRPTAGWSRRPAAMPSSASGTRDQETCSPR